MVGRLAGLIEQMLPRGNCLKAGLFLSSGCRGMFSGNPFGSVYSMEYMESMIGRWMRGLGGTAVSPDEALHTKLIEHHTQHVRSNTED